MHELSIAISLIETASEEAQRRHASAINAIHLKLGPLSGVVAEALTGAYELAREGTALAQSELVIEPIPITAFCPTCQARRQVKSMQEMRCPKCDTPTPEIVSGNELEVTALEIIE